MALMIIFKILGILVNAMTKNENYSLLNSENLPQPVQMQLSKKQKTFSLVFAAFLKTSSNVQYVQKKMTLTAYVFPKLQTAKEVVRNMSKMTHFETPFDTRHAKGSQTQLKSAPQHFSHIFSSILEKLSLKMSLLVLSELSEVFVNTLTTEDKYSLRYSENLPQPIQIQLSKKQKIFSQFIAAFLKSTSSFEHFEKRHDPHSVCISAIKNCLILQHSSLSVFFQHSEEN